MKLSKKSRTTSTQAPQSTFQRGGTDTVPEIINRGAGLSDAGAETSQELR